MSDTRRKIRNTLSFARLHTSEIYRQPEGYKIRSDCKSWWKNKLANICWKLMGKIGALESFGFREKIYHYDEPERGKVSEIILKSIENILVRGEREEEYCVVLGAKEFQEIIGEYAHDRGYMNIVAGPFHYARGGYQTTIYDLPVHVVAGVSGVALIPKVLVEKKSEAA